VTKKLSYNDIGMTEKELFIPVLLGTAREGRVSEKVARYVYGQVEQYPGIATEFIDIADHLTERTVPSWEEHEQVSWWREKIATADGLIIVSPEYNHSYPGELKLLLDKILPEYKHKPIAVCSASNGPWGGARMVENLWGLLVRLGGVPVFPAVYFPGIKELFDEAGAIRDAEYDERVRGMLDELAWLGRALKAARAAEPGDGE